jgi:hypothetical protein
LKKFKSVIQNISKKNNIQICSLCGKALTKYKFEDHWEMQMFFSNKYSHSMTSLYLKEKIFDFNYPKEPPLPFSQDLFFFSFNLLEIYHEIQKNKFKKEYSRHPNFKLKEKIKKILDHRKC